MKGKGKNRENEVVKSTKVEKEKTFFWGVKNASWSSECVIFFDLLAQMEKKKKIGLGFPGP